ncbi:MAG: hypothetical protein GX318_06075, partial [Clostridia bacterium]|nr:hypothetical protein [Clostridia bacterium]
MTLRVKLFILFMLIIMINVLVGYSVYTYINTQDEYANYINLAGRQRALSQKMAKEVLLCKDGFHEIDSDLQGTFQLFEETHFGFIDGNPEQNQRPVKDEGLIQLLGEITELWPVYKDYLSTVKDGADYSGTEFNRMTMELFAAADA